MKAINKLSAVGRNLSNLEDIPLLFIRLVLAYGFFVPAKTKWTNINSVSEWLGSMNYPLPALSTYLAASTEALGVILLLLGLGTRLISVPLIFVMLVAIFTVHRTNGFNAGDNGFEIPLYYMVMLLLLLFKGPGNFSIDNLFNK